MRMNKFQLKLQQQESKKKRQVKSWIYLASTTNDIV